MNGFGGQGGPRNPENNPVKYPFKSLDPAVTMQQQKSGERVYDINTDGVNHYGLYPDWIEDLRMLAGDDIVEDMARGAESYLQQWERVKGIRAAHRCPAGGGDFKSRSLKKNRLGFDAFQQLKKVRRQPLVRGRAWRYCVREPRTYERARLIVVFSKAGKVAMIVTTAKSHRAAGIGVKDKMTGKAIQTKAAGKGNSFVYGVRKGRVRYVGLASKAAAKNGRTLKRYLRLAGLR